MLINGATPGLQHKLQGNLHRVKLSIVTIAKLQPYIATRNTSPATLQMICFSSVAREVARKNASCDTSWVYCNFGICSPSRPTPGYGRDYI